MRRWQVPRTRIGRILSAIAIGLALIVGAFLLLLAIADAGLLDGAIRGWASHRLGRPVQFRDLRMHLLSRRPEVEVRGLVIANPPWIGSGAVAEVERLRARLRPFAMLRGNFDPSELSLEGTTLHLVRLRAGRNNWTFGTRHHEDGPAFAPLRAVRRLTIADGRLDYVDLARKLRLHATLSHDNGRRTPLRLGGVGTLDGFPVQVSARGGALNGADVGRPYPFVARLVDGATTVDARGTSGDPFDLTTFRLAIVAHGPNLADLGYLFNLRTPNSAPFQLKTVATADGSQFTFRPLTVRFGGSDLQGWIRSDHSTSRHRATAELRSAAWTREDVRAVLASLPPRASARSRSGALPPAAGGRWILPDTPLPAENLRALDLQATVHVGAVRGYPLPLDRLAARIALRSGKLTYTILDSELYGGRLRGSLAFDVRGSTPRVAVTAELSGARLARMSAGSATPLSGELALTAQLRGAGGSIHEAASRASGSATLRIRNGSLPPAAAFMIGGDTLSALRSMGDARRPIALDCLSAGFRGASGRLSTETLAIRTAAGDTIGRGVLDLSNESVRFRLIGTARDRKLFQLAMPVLIEGPVAHPRVSVMPARNARKLGLKGKLGLALSPLAAMLPMGKQAPIIAKCR